MRFEARYLVCGVLLWLFSLWTAVTTADQLPDLVRGSLGATFLSYFLFSVTGNHLAFEAMDKARAKRSALAVGDVGRQ